MTMESIFDLVAKELKGVKFSSDSMELEVYDLVATNMILTFALMDKEKPFRIETVLQ